ncbi:fimbrial protein [Erwinia tasmaniensis]|uniref:Fimbrial protein: virulence factor, contains adhesin and pectin lyase component probable involved in degradation of the plant cell wall n=1 Tax=Erwinia tasmaniensis (strain DSM 17950 / CFBP 7177 / CIP 109463 / NCPPB 4357 / Et1/99) TaxID=465817 RepID=B2VJM2_ERWT9|nr:fimbrial protein [Erwinia tasmaniensis]CAO98351.1 Fimbrial protein: virulence factor, contains adhesin and pectin lyase component probable involved in degradation of the plant cell wall [Erwinia tasmaniensis Et1/99]
MKNKIVRSVVYALLCMVSAGGLCADYGGHITWPASLTGAPGTGRATLNLQAPRQSSASIGKGNVWVAWGADTYHLNRDCIQWNGTAYLDVEYKRKGGGWLGSRTIAFPANFFVSSDHISVEGNVWTDVDAVRINSINSSGLIIENTCFHNEEIWIQRAISIGENHWDMEIKGTIPFRAQCTVSVDTLVDLGDIKYGDLVKSPGGLLMEKKVKLPVQWHCSGNNLNEKITITTNKVSNGCVGTGNDSLRFCLFRENSAVPIDLSQGTASFSAPQAGESTHIMVVPGAGKNPQPGESQGIMTVRIEPQ